MGDSKSNSKRKVHSDKCLPLKKKNLKQPNFIPQKTQKRKINEAQS